MLFDYEKSFAFTNQTELTSYQQSVDEAHRLLHSGQGLGSEYTGWLDWPSTYDREEMERVEKTAAVIRQQAQVFVVIGIGGSYLGARAGIEFLKPSFFNERKDGPAIYFAGNTISANYLQDLLDVIGEKDLAINVISKSGTTTEPAIAFRIFRTFLEKKYGKAEARKRIYVTTDKEKGALKKMATVEQYQTFTIPDAIGGRYSVLTSVGMLPLAVAGVDIWAILRGAEAAAQEYANPDLTSNACYQYAVMRRILDKKGKKIELLVGYEPKLVYFAEWWKQLFGESEGKEGKGIFPAAANFSTDLHSLGQFIQEGSKLLFETVLYVTKSEHDFLLTAEEEDVDDLNYLAKKHLTEVNEKAYQGTLLAHQAGAVPNLLLHIPELSPYYFGKLVYFFEKACAISAYLLGVNPFDQPGVEAYKKNMFHLLQKPGC